jgi:hypothetical protein
LGLLSKSCAKFSFPPLVIFAASSGLYLKGNNFCDKVTAFSSQEIQIWSLGRLWGACAFTP